jgi:hypothetical protein
MSDTIVTNEYRTVLTVDRAPNTVVTVDSTPKTIVTGMMGPPATARLSDFQDLDLTGLTDGSLLIYNAATLKWTAATELKQQTLEGGQY